MIRSFTLGDAVVLCGLLWLTPTFVCAVSLWGDSYGIVFCLKIFANFLMAYNMLAPIDANGAVASEFVISSIKYSAALVSDH